LKVDRVVQDTYLKRRKLKIRERAGKGKKEDDHEIFDKVI